MDSVLASLLIASLVGLGFLLSFWKRRSGSKSPDTPLLLLGSPPNPYTIPLGGTSSRKGKPWMGGGIPAGKGGMLGGITGVHMGQVTPSMVNGESWQGYDNFLPNITERWWRAAEHLAVSTDTQAIFLPIPYWGVYSRTNTRPAGMAMPTSKGAARAGIEEHLPFYLVNGLSSQKARDAILAAEAYFQIVALTVYKRLIERQEENRINEPKARKSTKDRPRVNVEFLGETRVLFSCAELGVYYAFDLYGQLTKDYQDMVLSLVRKLDNCAYFDQVTVTDMLPYGTIRKSHTTNKKDRDVCLVGVDFHFIH